MRAASLKHRLYLPDANLPNATDAANPVELSLRREQTHYLANVLRLRSGQSVCVFDGSGLEFAAEITHLDRKGATLELSELTGSHSPNTPQLTLGVALLKNQAMDTALQKATELGVDKIKLLTSERTNGSLSGERLAKRMSHWRGVIRAACEQSGRCWLPTLDAPVELASYLSALTDDRMGSIFLLAPEGRSFEGFEKRDTTILIGPEGGWSEAELTAARHSGVLSRKLGTTILRGETACIAALSAVQQSWHWPPRH